jgi:hypothetical protein
MLERMGERTIFVDEFQDAASKDGDWLIIGKFTESVERSNRNYSAVYDCRMIVLFQLYLNSDGRGKHMYSFLTILFFYFKCFPDEKWSFRMVLKKKSTLVICA